MITLTTFELFYFEVLAPHGIAKFQILLSDTSVSLWLVLGITYATLKRWLIHFLLVSDLYLVYTPVTSSHHTFVCVMQMTHNWITIAHRNPRHILKKFRGNEAILMQKYPSLHFIFELILSHLVLEAIFKEIA